MSSSRNSTERAGTGPDVPSYTIAARARRDLADIATFTEETWGRDQRTKYLLRLDDAFALIVGNPEIGRGRDDLRANLRSLVVGQHVIYYRVARDGVVILRILHVARDIQRAF